MRLNLDEIDLDEVQEACFRRRPGRYREPYIIEKVIYLPRKNTVRIFFYEDEGHKNMGREFRGDPIEAPITEFTQLNRYVQLNKIL